MEVIFGIGYPTVKNRLNRIAAGPDVPRVEIRNVEPPSKKLRVLDMLSEGKITADEAERLLEVLEEQTNRSTALKTFDSALPRCLYVQVDPKEGAKDSEQVKITVPLTLL